MKFIVAATLMMLAGMGWGQDSIAVIGLVGLVVWVTFANRRDQAKKKDRDHAN